MIVVSEIGEQWSPQTAPERQAATEIIIIVPDGNTPVSYTHLDVYKRQVSDGVSADG